jgi:hypothetical protein
MFVAGSIFLVYLIFPSTLELASLFNLQSIQTYKGIEAPSSGATYWTLNLFYALL